MAVSVKTSLLHFGSVLNHLSAEYNRIQPVAVTAIAPRNIMSNPNERHLASGNIVKCRSDRTFITFNLMA
ncbi:predicted protein [Sclerotinia sclerotiorum 1980 UF-70]|uniref:Uncharacterized protein n=1 Tax=Sclerotinia sclerotiorum (strain ATCC 18683 / 1980 / Ss-1) TaxID=665079 RepID=A7EDW7_SCLS1|nr:predicted protein [Sclerotinia sclerotiorum 1980 UF-70]EDO01033.1 predicted protein [Sclerotinia sclerotiorum 1980 UF-70]